MSPNRSFRRSAAAVLLSLVLLSCSSTGDEDPGAISEEEMRSVLASLCRSAKARVTLGVDEIRSAVEDPELQRHAIEWQLAVISAIRYARGIPDVRAGIIEMWTRVYQMHAMIENEFGREYYGAGYPIAEQVAAELVRLADQAGLELVGAARFDEVQAQVERYAGSHAFGRDLKSGRVGDSGILGAGGSAVTWVLGLPMKPFTLGEGVGETAHSIQNVAVVADRAVDVVDDLPEETRLQVELLLLDLERVQTVQTLIADLSRVTKSIEGFERTAASLPADVRQEVSTVLDQIDTKQVELRETLDHARGLVAETNQVVTGAKETVEGVNAAVVQTKVTAESLTPVLADLTAAGNAWTGTANAVTKFMEKVDPPPDPNAPPEPEPTGPPAGSGSDIVDLGDSAVKLTATATELRGLTENLLTIIQSPDLTKRLEDVDGLAAATVDHITWRAIELFGAFFALLFVYKLLAMRFLSR
jgi:hypothetical protein